MTIRIALTLAGGVSLGAYQGGVAYELIWALSHRTNPAEPVFVDVLTGASAGSMTAGLLARTLLYDRDSASDLHRAWVSGISFELLMKGNRRSSFLSDEPIWDLARQVLRPPPQPRNPHPAAPHELWMAFTLSNLNGVNFGLGYAGMPGQFDTTVFSDWVIFKLPRLLSTTQEEDSETWKQIATAAIASGAFPFAFPTVNVERRLSDYLGSDLYQAEGSRGFTYIDGGLFNNEPVGLARDIVDQMELTYPEVYGDTRLYILVDPYVAGSSSVAEFPETPLGYQLVLNRALSAILGEASKRDWIRAERVNTRIQWQDTLLTFLAELIVRVAGTDQEDLARRAEQLAHNIAEQKVSYQFGGQRPAAEAVKKHLDDNIARIGPIVTTEVAAFRQIERDQDRTRIFLNVVYILENVAGLRKKVALDLHLISPAKGSLAGDFLANFGGFFLEDWREHDWRRGRADTRDTIRRLAMEHSSLDYSPDDPKAYIPVRDFSRVGERDIPPETFETIRNRLKIELARLISSGHASLPKRILADWGAGYLANKVIERFRGRGSGAPNPNLTTKNSTVDDKREGNPPH